MPSGRSAIDKLIDPGYETLARALSIEKPGSSVLVSRSRDHVTKERISSWWSVGTFL